eukprot:m.39466 g.39466  ORF g.39466 m.39466 type:complete len:611 (+) comp32744_c0_seq1:31-1863(+)
MSDIKVVPLGAGQDVGRSCILLNVGGKKIMLDCGMHMGFNDERRFPDFSYIGAGPVTDYLDCVIISHFHLDHCGALPYFTEMFGFDGPVYMTHPTKAICPILLEDYRKITVERRGETNFFTSAMIKDCMKKVVAVNLHQTVQVDDELEIKPYYAGHVLGAAMFQIKVAGQSVVYTGDYNMTPDRHLGAAWIDKCRPDLLITESTYATTIRDSKRCRERDFLMKVHEVIEAGGKILIPVFALGRAQELCILLETFWERMNLKAPIYFSTGLTEKANHYYKLFISWTNQKIKSTFVRRNMFEFKHIKAFERSLADNPGPMVLFATPGMLHAGLSLAMFKKWAPDPRNMLIMPGYCVAGTVGHKVLSGQRKIEIDKKTMIDVKLSVEYMSFSAHADAKGIMQLIRMSEPKNVMLVHGEKEKMQFLKEQIQKEFHVNCTHPANGEMVTIETDPFIEIDVDTKLIESSAKIKFDDALPTAKRMRADSDVLEGILIIRDSGMTLMEPQQALKELGLVEQQLRFTSQISVPLSAPPFKVLADRLGGMLKSTFQDLDFRIMPDGSIGIASVMIQHTQGANPLKGEDDRELHVSWSYQDNDLGSDISSCAEDFIQSISL